MKFMLQMNVKKGPYQMEGWSQEDVKRMVGFMNQTNTDLKAAGQWWWPKAWCRPRKRAS